MPLVACPDCGREISTAAVACPHCGRPAQLAAPASPPPLPKELRNKPNFLAKVPKTVWAIFAAGFFFFVLCSLVGKDHVADDPLMNSLLNGLAGGTGGLIIGAYISAIVISGLKGKPFMVVMGVLTIGMPAFSLWPVIGAIRIAKPNLRWAEKYYGPEKMQIAIQRFPKAVPLAKR